MKEATIVTFYSYKGGVGRSMALANVAWILAQDFHERVLVIDWDLEAPGLHRFFDLEDSDISGGLIELLNDYKDLLREEVKLPEKLVDIKQYRRKKYIREVETFSGGGSISLLPSGRQNDEYASRVNEFNWEEFYEKWHGFGFIEDLKQELKTSQEFDVILVDSRTGVTDIGGICTLQLPDTVVLLFALNEQNITGVRSVAERISKKAAAIEGRDCPPALILRPARVDRGGDQEALAKMQNWAGVQLREYLNEEDAERFIARKNIPYVSQFSNAETPLAVKLNPLGDMVESFRDLANSIRETSTNVHVKLRGPERSRKKAPWLFRSAGYLRKKMQTLLIRKKNRYILGLISLSLFLSALSALTLLSLVSVNRNLNISKAKAIDLQAQLANLDKELFLLREQESYEQQLASLKEIRDALPSGKRRQAITLAFDLKENNIGYADNGRRPETGFDLSGFIDYILSEPKIDIIKNPTNCNQDCLMKRSGISRAATLEELRPGDLIFYEYNTTMMYLGDQQCIGMIYKDAIQIKDVRRFYKIIGYGKVPYGD